MSLNPFDQFKVKPLVEITLLGHDVSFTNSSLFMVFGLLMISSFFLVASWKPALIPGKLQSFAEMMFNFTSNTLKDAAGTNSLHFAPIVFCLFSFILILNIMGLLPFGFTVTSQLIVTISFAILVFSIVVITGLIKHGLKFFSLFLPHGTPLFIAPLMILRP